MGIGGLEFGSGVTRSPGLVFIEPLPNFVLLNIYLCFQNEREKTIYIILPH